METADMVKYVQYAVTMAACARPALGLCSCTIGWTDIIEMIKKTIKLIFHKSLVL